MVFFEFYNYVDMYIDVCVLGSLFNCYVLRKFCFSALNDFACTSMLQPPAVKMSVFSAISITIFQVLPHLVSAQIGMIIAHCKLILFACIAC